MRITSITTAAICLCAAIILVGCGGGTNTVNTAPAANTAKNAAPATTNQAPANSATDTKSADAAGPNTGVAECDEYIKKYEACLSKIAAKAPQVEGAMKSAFEAQRTGFKQAASTAEGKAVLGPKCKEAMETAKKSTAAYQCDW